MSCGDTISGLMRPPDGIPKPRRRLQIGFLGRIIIALMAAGLIPLALLSFRFADLNREAMTSQVLQTHALSANTGADRISSTVSAWETLIDALVAAPEVESDPSSTAAKETVRSLLQSRGDLVAVVLRDPTGAEIFRGQKKSAASVIQAILANPQRERLEVHTGDGGAWLSIVRPLTNGGQTTAIFDAGALEDDLHSSELGEQAIRVLIDRSRHSVVGNPEDVAGIPPALLNIAATGRIRGAGSEQARDLRIRQVQRSADPPQVGEHRGRGEGAHGGQQPADQTDRTNGAQGRRHEEYPRPDHGAGHQGRGQDRTDLAIAALAFATRTSIGAGDGMNRGDALTPQIVSPIASGTSYRQR